MKTLEIKEQGWRDFCRKTAEFCRGAMISIELEDSGGKKTIVQDLPLQGFDLVNTETGCNTNLIVEAGLPDQKSVRHVIIEPIHIRLRNETGSDRYNRVHISAENGTTIIQLHPGLNQAFLEQLDLAA